MESRLSHARLCLAFMSMFLVAATGSAQSGAGPVPTPSQFLRFEVGADRQLADYKQISSYFRALDEASPRMEIENLGPTTLGADMIMAVISSEENLRNKARIKEIAARLSDPRGWSAQQVDALAKEGKTILLVTCNIHATEIGASQMAMEWAHRLVTANDAETRKRLSDVILLLVPSLNPDGQTLVTEWYRKHVGTKYEGSRMPYLYHHYVGHDNNRDWYMLTQKETINMHRAVYHDWHPQFWLDEHQMGMNGPRIYVPPNADPVAEKVHPLIHRGNNLMGMTMAWRLEEAKKSGVISGYAFDAYWPGGTRNTGWWRNAYGVLTEVASARMATPVEVDPTELSGGAKGLIDYQQQINFPNPWPGGTWRLRDIIDYELIISDAALETASKFGEALRRGVAQMAQDAVASGRDDEFWLIPTAQRNPVKATKLARLMQDHGLEVRMKADGSAYLLPTKHPFVKFADEMLGIQRYPEIRTQQGAAILAPYDVAAWSLPLLMGLEGVKRQKLTAEESRSAAITTPIEVPKQTIADIAKVTPRFFVTALGGLGAPDTVQSVGPPVLDLHRLDWMRPTYQLVLDPLTGMLPAFFLFGSVVLLLVGPRRSEASLMVAFALAYGGALLLVLPESKHFGPMLLPLCTVAGAGLWRAARLAFSGSARKEAIRTVPGEVLSRSSAKLVLGAGAVVAVLAAAAAAASSFERRGYLAEIERLTERGTPAPETLLGRRLFSFTIGPGELPDPRGYLLTIRAGAGPAVLVCRHRRGIGSEPSQRLYLTRHLLAASSARHFFVTGLQGAFQRDLRTYVCTVTLEGDAKIVESRRLDLSSWRRPVYATVFGRGEWWPGSPRIGHGIRSTEFFGVPSVDVDERGLTPHEREAEAARSEEDPPLENQ